MKWNQVWTDYTFTHIVLQEKYEPKFELELDMGIKKKDSTLGLENEKESINKQINNSCQLSVSFKQDTLI